MYRSKYKDDLLYVYSTLYMSSVQRGYIIYVQEQLYKYTLYMYTVQEQLYNELLDKDARAELETELCINWSEEVKNKYHERIASNNYFIIHKFLQSDDLNL